MRAYQEWIGFSPARDSFMVDKTLRVQENRERGVTTCYKNQSTFFYTSFQAIQKAQCGWLYTSKSKCNAGGLRYKKCLVLLWYCRRSDKREDFARVLNWQFYCAPKRANVDAFLGLIFLPKSSDRVRYISLPSLHSPTNTLRSASIAEKRSSSSEAGKRQKMGEWEREEESSLQSTLKKGGEEDIFLHGPHPTPPFSPKKSQKLFLRSVFLPRLRFRSNVQPPYAKTAGGIRCGLLSFISSSQPPNQSNFHPLRGSSSLVLFFLSCWSGRKRKGESPLFSPSSYRRNWFFSPSRTKCGERTSSYGQKTRPDKFGARFRIFMSKREAGYSLF